MNKPDSELTALKDQLHRASFPLWSTIGLDQTDGFIERLTPTGHPLQDKRRARLVGRQIYSFATAQKLGWDGPALAMVQRGVDFLMTHVIDGSRMISLVDLDGTPASHGFDLYDQAFVLFGLAAAAGVGEQTDRLTTTARNILGGMTDWRHPEAGFEEARPRTLPLKANPHMHMLEASLAWAGIDPDPRWNRLADEIVELCLRRFLDPSTGALREFFDGNWGLLNSPDHDVVEPGHQFEWAWLLTRWGLSRKRDDALAAARRLIDVAESHGVSGRRMAINELGPDLSVRDDRHRLWPQTERIKAFVAASWIAPDQKARDAAAAKVSEAARGLLNFFEHPVKGAWWEHLGPDGTPHEEPSRASSLYHITCAVREMDLAGPLTLADAAELATKAVERTHRS